MKTKRFFYTAIICSSFIFSVLGISCTNRAATTVTTTETTMETNLLFKYGQIFEVGIVPIKDFETQGLIFVESSATYDLNGNIIDGSEITYDMLMREAQKLGADAIINLKIDERQRFIETEEVRITSRGTDQDTTRDRRVVFSKIIEYRANALAIRYTDAILVPAVFGSNESSNSNEVD